MCPKVQCMKSRTIQSALFIVFTVMLSGAIQGAVCGEPVDFECEVFRLTNDERAIHGLPELAWNALLFDAAHSHSVDMATHDNMSHTGSNGSRPSDRISDSGYEFQAYGENVAYNYANPAAVVAGWMGSPGHRQNILNENFCELGVGLAYSDANDPYWTQNFARPVNACPAVTTVTPCDEATGGDTDNDGAVTNDATSSVLETETSTNTDAADVAKSSGGGGCFLSVAGILP